LGNRDLDKHLKANKYPYDDVPDYKKIYKHKSYTNKDVIASVKSRPRINIDELKAMDTSTMNPKDLKAHQKKIYMYEWRQKHSDYKPKSKLNSAISLKSNGSGVNNRFALERDFDLSDKDISLIISYLISWKGMGRLNVDENLKLDAIQGLSKTKLSETQRSNLREAFYSARSRVLASAKVTSLD
jgi:hypothetical protein